MKVTYSVLMINRHVVYCEIFLCWHTEFYYRLSAG